MDHPVWQRARAFHHSSQGTHATTRRGGTGKGYVLEDHKPNDLPMYSAGWAHLVSKSAVLESDSHQHVLQLPLLQLGQPDERGGDLVLRLHFARRRRLHLLVRLGFLFDRLRVGDGRRYGLRLLQQVLPAFGRTRRTSYSRHNLGDHLLLINV